jgi:hypothetical protein
MRTPGLLIVISSRVPASLVKVYTEDADPNRVADVLWLTAVRSADCQARQMA